ncbi:hypothetical protein COK72_02150 [Bacillus thuringiensis]|uniref:Uncharacterized protein n=1 Tax=Bacillus thuringiensis TaxID=1428 RepID=A0A9X7FXY8_BACTU|nr:hypothetical protein COK72_02150 [Bacillus thuringiensis]PFY22867.1 hypothetical protein COL44_18470 [Bacillus toyonensis]
MKFIKFLKRNRTFMIALCVCNFMIGFVTSFDMVYSIFSTIFSMSFTLAVLYFIDRKVFAK